MKYQSRIILISVAIAIVLSVLFSVITGSFGIKNYVVGFGVVGFFGGILELIVGLFLLLLKDKRPAQGLLMAGGLMMLVGFLTCTSQL